MVKSTSDKGKWGEDIAAEFLGKKGYRILFRNWRAERGDIDIIALDGDCLTFVEVKSGSSELYGPPELRITPSKKRQLYKLASVFIQNSQEYHIPNNSYRFDVIVIDGKPNKYEIRHFEHAFYL
ncbi:MAG: YraN family protein [Calditrichia bacterium]